MKCPNCDFESPETAKYCEKCGTKLPTEPPKTEQTSAAPAQSTASANAYTYAAPATSAAPAGTDSGSVSFWAFIGLLILFAIPLVGLIACIICCFVPDNKSIKNFARAILVLKIVGALILFAVVKLVKRVILFVADKFADGVREYAAERGLPEDLDFLDDFDFPDDFKIPGSFDFGDIHITINENGNTPVTEAAQ